MITGWRIERGEEYGPYVYAAKDYRVRVEGGAVLVYRRQPHTMIEGDNDELLKAFGVGSWTTLTALFKE